VRHVKFNEGKVRVGTDDDFLTLSWTYVGYGTRLCSGQTDGR